MYTVVKGAELYCYLNCRSNLIFLAFSTLAKSTFRNLMNSFVDTFSFSALRKTFQEKKITLYAVKNACVSYFFTQAVMEETVSHKFPSDT